MPTPADVLKDPNFKALPQDEQLKVLGRLDSNFSQLPQAEQLKVIGGKRKQVGPFPEGTPIMGGPVTPNPGSLLSTATGMVSGYGATQLAKHFGAPDWAASLAGLLTGGVVGGGTALAQKMSSLSPTLKAEAAKAILAEVTPGVSKFNLLTKIWGMMHPEDAKTSVKTGVAPKVPKIIQHMIDPEGTWTGRATSTGPTAPLEGGASVPHFEATTGTSQAPQGKPTPAGPLTNTVDPRAQVPQAPVPPGPTPQGTGLPTAPAPQGPLNSTVDPRAGQGTPSPQGPIVSGTGIPTPQAPSKFSGTTSSTARQGSPATPTGAPASGTAAMSKNLTPMSKLPDAPSISLPLQATPEALFEEVKGHKPKTVAELYEAKGMAKKAVSEAAAKDKPATGAKPAAKATPSTTVPTPKPTPKAPVTPPVVAQPIPAPENFANEPLAPGEVPSEKSVKVNRTVWTRAMARKLADEGLKSKDLTSLSASDLDTHAEDAGISKFSERSDLTKTQLKDELDARWAKKGATKAPQTAPTAENPLPVVKITSKPTPATKIPAAPKVSDPSWKGPLTAANRIQGIRPGEDVAYSGSEPSKSYGVLHKVKTNDGTEFLLTGDELKQLKGTQ